MKLPRDKTAIVLVESQNDFLSPGGTDQGDVPDILPQDGQVRRNGVPPVAQITAVFKNFPFETAREPGITLDGGSDAPAPVLGPAQGWAVIVTRMGVDVVGVAGWLRTICGLVPPFGPLKMRVVPGWIYPGAVIVAPCCPVPGLLISL